jgi:hypothetical protein
MDLPTEENPYRSTNPTLTPDDSTAKSIVKVPAMILMILSIAAILLSVLFILLNILKLGVGAAAADMNGVDGERAFMLMFQGGLGIVAQIISILIYAFFIFACKKMMALESRAMVWTMLILAVIPCCSPMCIGLPIAIWGIVVMNDPIVKTSFTS